MSFTVRPANDEYAPFYAGYVANVGAGDLLEILARQHADTQVLLALVSEERAGHRYEAGKWSIKEVVGHSIDAERVFSYRALSFARGDGETLPGMNQDPWVEVANFDGRTLADLATEWHHLRQANLRLFASFDAATLSRRGVASGHEITVRALVHIVAGHEAHHLKILRERYLA